MDTIETLVGWLVLVVFMCFGAYLGYTLTAPLPIHREQPAWCYSADVDRSGVCSKLKGLEWEI
jgi:hypothetical protein